MTLLYFELNIYIFHKRESKFFLLLFDNLFLNVLFMERESFTSFY